MAKLMPKLPLAGEDGGAPPALPPELPGVAEGPMRDELRRQIARLEHEVTRFAVQNLPHEAISTSPSRGPAMLTTADLERIRDELLETRARLHETVVARATPADAEPQRTLADRVRTLVARLRRR